MTPLQVGALVGSLVAGGVWCVVRAVQRAPRSLAAARHTMTGSVPLPGRPTQSPVAAQRWRDGLEHGAAGRLVAQRFGPGLRTIDLTPGDVVTRMLVAGLLALLTVVASVAVLGTAGLLDPSPWWLPVAMVVGALFAWVSVSDVRTRIDRRHRELRHATNEFVQLVAVGLTTDQSIEAAVRFALDVGSGEAFDVIRTRLLAAPLRGEPLWEAIEQLGAEYGIRELEELAGSIERQGLHGVSIGDTVATLAATMRATALDQLEREADQANANLSGPTIGFVVSTIVFLAYPLALRIGEAFGG
ncbi:MAG TPA: hypothetical protein DCR14_06935 [Acidimicrobiaceae bacterium]|nr:hypothetical protein [Acidimicrobiaceae bacterium]